MLLGKNSNQIAKECGASYNTICNWLKKFNINNIPYWKKNKVKIASIHRWVKEYKPIPDVCEICRQIEDENGNTILELVNIKNHQYRYNIDDFLYAHVICHRRYDAKRRKEVKIKL